jgi:hypothetical protein
MPSWNAEKLLRGDFAVVGNSTIAMNKKNLSAPVLAFVLVLAAVLLAVATLPVLRDIPFTNHAIQGHQAQQWNAAIISARISSRSCNPILAYACAHATIVMCPVGVPDDLWTGLIIGTDTGSPAVVTGYAAPASYWFRRVSSCLPVSYVP